MPVTWNKLIRKEIYTKIIFPATTYSEDRAIMTQVLFYCNSIGYINEAFYHWCIIPKSASRNKRNRIKNLIEDYISYISIIAFLKNNMENTNEFMDEVLKHTDKLGHLCSENNKILNYYKISIKEIIKIINVNSIDTNKITIERYNFEKIVKELDRKNHRKHIVFVKNEIKKMIPQWFKKCIKNILKHGHGT